KQLFLYLIQKSLLHLQDYLVRTEPVVSLVPCELLIRYFGDLDPKVVDFAASKTLIQMAFEWSGSLLIRIPQRILLREILSEPQAPSYLPKLRQAIMGIGKSAVLVPYLMLVALTCREYSPVFALQPQHLVTS